MQLYNRLLEQGRSADELGYIRRAYDFALTLYTGYFMSDGRPFLSHFVGTASIAAQLGLSTRMVAVACLHSVYTNGNFGDGRKRNQSPARRRRVVDVVGAQAETAIRRFHGQRMERRFDDANCSVERLDTLDRDLLTIDLADLLEKFTDLGVLYLGNRRWEDNVVERHGEQIRRMAERLGHPQLAAALHDEFERSRNAQIPECLRQSGDWRYAKLVMPNACRLGWPARLGLAARWALRAVR